METAQAQTSDKLVSNTGQTVTSSSVTSVGVSGDDDRWRLFQGFTTGDYPLGYEISAVDVRLGTVGGSAAVRVSIYSTSSSAYLTVAFTR